VNGACAIPAPRCGYLGPGVGGHHVLGRREDGRYVAPEIVIPLCQREGGTCHQGGVHRLLRAAGVEGPMPASDWVLVLRIATTLGWLSVGRTGELLIPCAVVADLADVLGRIGRDLRHQEHTS
jgi:hypothetical protein